MRVIWQLSALGVEPDIKLLQPEVAPRRGVLEGLLKPPIPVTDTAYHIALMDVVEFSVLPVWPSSLYIINNELAVGGNPVHGVSPVRYFSLRRVTAGAWY